MTIHNRLPPGKYRLTVDDYMRLDDAGVFGEARTELIAGEIIVMAPEYRPHAYVRDELAYRMRRVLEETGSDLFVGSGSVRLSATDMPQPDIVLTSAPRGEGPIPAGSVALLVEVSATTLRTDVGEKSGRYALAGIPEYWIVDAAARTIHQRWQPESGSYRQARSVPLDEPVTAATIGGLTTATNGL